MWRVVAGTVCFAVPVTVTVLDVFGYVAKVEGASMQPALNPVNQKGVDYVFLNRWKARDYNFDKGEIVSLASPSDPEQKIIKRVVARDGETVKTLNYKNKYVRVPEGHCWVEGDHHGQSLDSNFFGPVAQGLINAKATHIVWPPSRWQRINKVPIPKDRFRKPSDALLDAHLSTESQDPFHFDPEDDS